jgi:hypothetical protein
MTVSHKREQRKFLIPVKDKHENRGLAQSKLSRSQFFAQIPVAYD